MGHNPRHSRFRQGLNLAALTALVALLAFAPSATAGTRSKSVTVQGNGATGDVVAKCKTGQRATGGGFLTSPSTTARALVVTKSAKSGQKAWQVIGQVVDPGAVEAATITAYVYCDSNAPRTSTVTQSITGTNSNFALSTTCRTGKVKAGGFSLSLPTFTNVPMPTVNRRVSDSYRLSKATWRTVFTITSPQPATMTSLAYCASGAGGSRVGSATGITSVSAITSRCSNGVAAGGFSQSPFGRQVIYQSMKAGKTWRASGTQLPANPPPAFVTSTLVARAYCR